MVATIGREKMEVKQTLKHNNTSKPTIVLKNIREHVLPITGKKKAGLMKLCNSSPPSIPTPFHKFYRSFPSTTRPVVKDNDFNDSDYDDLD